MQPNLFGTIDIVCHWGRLGTNSGGYKVISCDSQKDIELAIKTITKRRKTRGYLICYDH